MVELKLTAEEMDILFNILHAEHRNNLPVAPSHLEFKEGFKREPKRFSALEGLLAKVITANQGNK